MLTTQSEAKRFLAALEKRCQLAGASEVSVAQLHALGTNINLSVNDMDTFIEQLNNAGMPVLSTSCHGSHESSCPPEQHVLITVGKGMHAGPAGASIAETSLETALQGCHVRAFKHPH